LNLLGLNIKKDSSDFSTQSNHSPQTSISQPLLLLESSSHNNSLHNVGEIIARNSPAQIGKIQIIVLPAKRKEKPNSDYAYHFDPKDESPGISFNPFLLQ